MALDLTNATRSLIKMDMTLERKVVESFVSTLKMSEHSPDDTMCSVSLTLGELRQHVQYCQYAANQVNEAEAANAQFSRMSMKAKRADAIVKAQEVQFGRIQQLLARANNISGQMKEFDKEIAAVNRQQGLIKVEIADAKADN